MILQALVTQYEDLVQRGVLAAPGWNAQKISYALYINDAGKLEQVVSLKVETLVGKKIKLLPQQLNVPAAVKRASNIKSNFLWDNSSYVLGFDAKGKPERAKECFAACRGLHHKLLDGVNSPAAAALLAFFDHWEPANAEEHPALAESLEDIMGGANLVFRYQGEYVHEDPVIRAAWQACYGDNGEGEKVQCLVTGKEAVPATLHPSIKGIQGAQSSGASLVSFNAPSFCSFGKEQGLNAPTSGYAAFAYGAALNYMIADREHTFRIGDTTVLAWASGAEPAYNGLLSCSLFGANSAYTSSELNEMTGKLCRGESVVFDETLLDPKRTFYILGIAPNAARLSIRFFMTDSFGTILRNVNAHQQRLEIQRSARDRFETLPLWKLLSETVNQKATDKTPSPVMAGDVLRAILNGTQYPATLLNGINLRIRAEHEINGNRAAIIKAYYLKNEHKDVPKEVLQVSLNPESTSIPYQLGRLFCTLEQIQQAANPGINTTIRDKYFNSASATPAVVFPTLLNLAQKHLKKIGGGLAVTLNRQLTEIMNKLGDGYPARLSLAEQGAFQLGYYHQTAVRFEKKKED